MDTRHVLIGWRAYTARSGIYKGSLRVEKQVFSTWAGARLWCEQGRHLFPDHLKDFARFACSVVPVYTLRYT
jgi:hypothetical protein